MAVAVDRFYPLAEGLLGHLQSALNAAPNPPKTVSLRPGDTDAGVSVYEDEAVLGLAYVRIVGFPPTVSFPEQMETWTPGGPAGWALALEMGVLRAAPIGKANRLPTPQEWAAAIEQQMSDAACMRQAAYEFAATLESETYLLGAWEEVPPFGGRMGGTMTVTVMVDNCEV